MPDLSGIIFELRSKICQELNLGTLKPSITDIK